MVSNTHFHQYPFSILMQVFLDGKLYNFALLNAGDSGKHQNLQAIFTLVNITYEFSKVRVGLPGVCVFEQGNESKVPP